MGVVGASFVGYFALLTYCNLHRPEDPGLFVDFSGGRMTVLQVAAGAPGDRAGLQPGDRILSWNRRLVQDLDWMISDANLEIGQAMPLVVEREGVRLQAALVLNPPPWTFWRSREAWMLLAVRAVQLVCLVLAGVIAVTRHTDPTARLGAWLLATFAVFCAVLPYRTTAVWGHLPTWPGALLWIPYLSGLAIAALLSTFLAVFPRRLISSRRGWLLVWVPMALALIQPASYTLQLVYWPDRVRADSFGGTPLVIVSVGYLLWGAATLARNYRRLEDISERRRVRVVVGGLIAGGLFGLPVIPMYWLAPVDDLGSTIFTSPWFALGTLLLLAIPLSFTYAILRHRLFDIRIIIRQGVRYALARRVILWLAPGVGLALMAEFVVWHRQDPLAAALRTHVWSYLILGALIATAGPRRSQWLDAIDRRFFRDRYDGQQLLRRVAEDLHGAGTLERVAPLLVGQLESAFHAEFAAVLVHRLDETHYQVIASAPAGRAPRPIDARTKFAGLLRLLGRPVEIGLPDARWLAQQLPAAETEWLKETRLELVVPVAATSGETEAAIALGPKRSEEPYTDDDKDLLVAIAQSLALLLDRPVAASGPRTFVEECPECGACYGAGTGHCAREGATLVPGGTTHVVAGRYRLQQRLGEGGMGTVYSAVDVALDREVAVKLIRQALALRPEAADRFQQEARAAASFAHPNIVTVHDFGATDGNPFIVMELLKGMTLRDLLRQQERLTPSRTLEILSGVCAALEVAHRRQLVHRDLKPENIFLGRSETAEQPKVLDFGIAKYHMPADSSSMTRLSTPPGILIGTPGYMSPEQLRGREPDPSADVWALGVIAFEMLIGVHPQRATTSGPAWRPASPSLDEVMSQVDVPDAWKAFFTRALSADPAVRPRTSAEFYAGLEGVLKGSHS